MIVGPLVGLALLFVLYCINYRLCIDCKLNVILIFSISFFSIKR